MIKKLFALCLALFLGCTGAFADDKEPYWNFQKAANVQQTIDETGFKLLNANKLDKIIVFSHNKKRNIVKEKMTWVKREVIVYDKDLIHAQSDDELAALLAREVSLSMRTYDGSIGGIISALQVKMSPKKYELVADKRAADYMVTAGYNPLGLITYIVKSAPQKKQDAVSSHNLTSKRLMHIYEHIYFKYPCYLVNNTYIDNEYYQHFLLSSIENRRKLEVKIKTKDKGRVDYE